MGTSIYPETIRLSISGDEDNLISASEKDFIFLILFVNVNYVVFDKLINYE